MSAIARVALDVPVDSAFDYEIGALPVAIGSLVVVSFGRRRAVGVVVGITPDTELPPARLKRVERILPVEPLAGESLSLATFCSNYYRHPLGQTLAATLPTQLRKPSHRERVSLWSYALTDPGRQQALAALSAKAAGARRLLAALQQYPRVDTAQARLIYSRAPQLLQRWLEWGWVERRADEGMAPSACAPAAPEVAQAKPTLTLEQHQAIERILAQDTGYRPWLLQGVTGSGKTEVYLALIESIAARGGQTLLLVPEINLTPQLEERFRARLPRLSIVSLHSGLPEGERLQRWQSARSGRADVVLGTRLAVFTPMPKLALVVVDEEHDSSYKQQDGLRYHARDIAVFLASARATPIVLGSATPSLESYWNALNGRYGHLRLRGRPAANLPQVRRVDVRGIALDRGLSPALIEAIGVRLERQEQSLVYINRRGYAPVLMCQACGWLAECTRCAARMTLHLNVQRLRCHYCGHETRIAPACPVCGNQDLHGVGQGTQRVEEAIAVRFPGARVLRVDSDSIRRRGAFEAMRARIHAHDVDILVGTQILAKGHDFPRLTLVGVVGADHGLYSSDFRAAERLFQQLMQVSGRAGRADLPGEVLVQTEFPDHPLYQALALQDFEVFGQTLLEERQHAGFPPYVYQALLRAEAHTQADVEAFLERSARLARQLGEGVQVYDPVAATVARIAGRFRAQLLIQSNTRGVLRHFLERWHPRLVQLKASKVRWALDIDPVEL